MYLHLGNFSSAGTEFASVISSASSAGVSLESDFLNVVDDESSEVLFSTIFSTSIADAYTGGSTEFNGWVRGNDTKSLMPLDTRLAQAFDASSASGGGTDLRKALTVDETSVIGLKYNGGLEQDYIELRLSDVILMYAEALNETGSPASTVLPLLDDIRTRAGLNSLTGTVSSQAEVREAIYDERRLELALEGHRWFDLVRTNTVDQEMGESISSDYHVFPIPNSEVLATAGVITQNPGY